MAIFGKIKKAFGFSDADLEGELSDDFPSAAVTPLKKANTQSADSSAPDNTPNSQQQEIPQTAVISSVVPDELFESVVRIFNDSLPSFIKDNLDAEKQRRQIYEALSDSMKDFISNLEETAKQNSIIEMQREHSKLRQEIEAMQARSKQIEEQSTELKELKLSAERQKRALSERVHDLEAQIASFDAEREQYELENKSLVNKLRSSSVQEEDIKILNTENQALKEQIRLLKTGVNPDDEAPKLRETIQSIQKDLDSALADKKQLNDDVALLKKRCEIADSMINDLNHRASAAQQSLGQRDQELATIKIELEEAKSALEAASSTTDEAETEKLRQEVQSANERLQTKEQEIAELTKESEESKAAIAMFEETLTKFEEIKSAKNKSITDLTGQVEELKSANKKLDDDLKTLDVDFKQLTDDFKRVSAENESLKSTIENNLQLQAASEAALREEIERLKSSTPYQKGRRGRKPKEASPLDETLDNTDWLISSPPAGENARPTIVSDSEFGYQEPKRKDPPSEDSSQMLLW